MLMAFLKTFPKVGMFKICFLYVCVDRYYRILQKIRPNGLFFTRLQSLCPRKTNFLWTCLIFFFNLLQSEFDHVLKGLITEQKLQTIS